MNKTSKTDLLIQRSSLNKIELWREMSRDHENQWLIIKSPFAQHFFASVRLQESKKVRRDHFFASRGLDSSAITIAGQDFYWTQAAFNERDKLVQSILAKNPNITNAQIIAKFKKIRVDEDFLYSKQLAEWDAKLTEAESSARTNKEWPEWARWIADNLLGLVFMGAMTLFLVDCAYNGNGNVSDECSPLGLEKSWDGKWCR
jgi:hypothetical protein|tara:strand:+ start:399 stop:1004 length:606 start_codon:yes stop_codon:yes gene_type:complete